MTAQKRSGKNPKSVQANAVLGHFAKSDIHYWQRSIFRQTYRRNGKTLATRDWAMKVAHEGRRETFPLKTPNKAAAAALARDVYLSLVVNGWEATVARYKRRSVAVISRRTSGQQCSVGEFLDAIFRIATNQRTVEAHAKRFRQIVSDNFRPLRRSRKA